MGWSYTDALAAHDGDAMVKHFSPDVIVHSPLTATPFEGMDEVTRLYRAVLSAVSHTEVSHELAEPGTKALFLTTMLGGRRIEMAERFALDANGKIREIWIFVRPMPDAALFASEVGPLIAPERRRGLVAAAARPVPPLLRAFDRLGARLVR